MDAQRMSCSFQPAASDNGRHNPSRWVELRLPSGSSARRPDGIISRPAYEAEGDHRSTISNGYRTERSVRIQRLRSTPRASQR